jgi:hypothetical protein
MSKKLTNLLDETIKRIEGYGKTIDDVQWVGDEYIHFTWDEFVELAKNFDYDSGFGGNAVINELMVVGTDWWMTRGEYDGSEWWDFHIYPLKPKQHIKPKHLNDNWGGNLNHNSSILQANFETDEELKQYIRENSIDVILDEEPK